MLLFLLPNHPTFVLFKLFHKLFSILYKPKIPPKPSYQRFYSIHLSFVTMQLKTVLSTAAILAYHASGVVAIRDCRLYYCWGPGNDNRRVVGTVDKGHSLKDYVNGEIITVKARDDCTAEVIGGNVEKDRYYEGFTTASGR